MFWDIAHRPGAVFREVVVYIYNIYTPALLLGSVRLTIKEPKISILRLFPRFIQRRSLKLPFSLNSSYWGVVKII